MHTALTIAGSDPCSSTGVQADIRVMTTPDRQTYHLKKSIVQDNIEYIYMDHAMGDVNLSYRKHALDHFDTIFVPNELTEREIREQERIYDLPARPEKVKAAWEARQQGKDLTPPKYYLGEDFEDVLDEIRANPM